MRDSPAARMKSKAPNEMPFSACSSASSGLIGPSRLFPGILHAGDLVGDHVRRLPVLYLHLADVHVLDRIVGVLVEREVAARALEGDVLERTDEAVLVLGGATGLL